MQTKESNVHAGHRQRMGDRFFRNGADAFDSYELLEMLLYYRIPYKDTNPIAHRLLERFGTLDAIFRADTASLCEINGVGPQVASYLQNAGTCGEDGLLIQEEELILNEYDRVGQFFLKAYKKSAGTKPPIYMLLLDNRMHFLALEEMGDCSFASAAIRPQRFVERALLRSAAVVIIAHAHPHGPLFLTPEERMTDSHLHESFKLAGVVYAEHYLFCGDTYCGNTPPESVRFCQYEELENFDRSRRAALRSGAPHVADASAFSGPLFTDSLAFMTRFLAPACADEDKRQTAARALLDRYGRVRRILDAEITQLMEIPSVGRTMALYIKLLVALTARRVTDTFTFGQLHDTEQLQRYLTYRMVGEPIECVYMLMMDEDLRAVACRRITEGSVNSSTITPRRFLEIALQHRAKYIVIAHNHPSGNTTPSEDDYRTTQLLQTAFHTVGIRMIDHFIVAGNACASMARLSATTLAERYDFTFYSQNHSPRDGSPR